jgi:twitching motility protein PilT
MDKLNDLLAEAKIAGASDVHLAPGRPPYFRIDGQLRKAAETVLTDEHMQAVVKQMVEGNQKAQQEFTAKQQTDFSYSLKDKTRFRVNAFYRTGRLAVALRLIMAHTKTIEELHLPGGILEFAEMRQGFLLVTGPAGEGKSTTLAALVNYINQTRSEHIISIEDPIEYLFTEALSIIDQREIGRDAVSFPAAIRATLRQDPDVILIGELRDRSSMQTALTLAETGHLVMASLHTNDAAQTIQRIIDIFPASQQSQVRSQLAASLSGVITQRLIPTGKGGRLPAIGIMRATTAIRNAIREDKAHQIEGIIQTSHEVGMQTLDKSIQDLVSVNLITKEAARLYLSPDAARD